MPPRVRFAPSPTGYLHIGGARTALFNWLHARRNGGVFVLRMEDTDRKRSTPESVQAILDGLKWLGLDWDEGPGVGGKYGPYFQTERMASYAKYVDQLLAAGKAYRCWCTKEELEAKREASGDPGWKYDGKCRERKDTPSGPAVLRFKMPKGSGTYSFDDLVLGQISKTYDDLDDFVMQRADGIPLYNFGCVVDDHEMDITLVGRGQEHVNSTLPQLALYDALGWKAPQFAHFPLILASDRKKLSKRLHPEADVMLHKQAGILPEALLNFVVRLGWGYKDEEYLPLERLKEIFSLDGVGKTSGVWNPEKLVWINQQYLKKLPESDVAGRVAPLVGQPADARLAKLVVGFRERSKNLVELAEKIAPYFKKGVSIEAEAAAKHLTADGKAVLAKAQAVLVSTEWSAAAIDAALKRLAETTGLKMGAIAQPLRVAATGTTTSPGIGDTLELLGRDEALERIAAALK